MEGHRDRFREDYRVEWKVTTRQSPRIIDAQKSIAMMQANMRAEGKVSESFINESVPRMVNDARRSLAQGTERTGTLTLCRTADVYYLRLRYDRERTGKSTPRKVGLEQREYTDRKLLGSYGQADDNARFDGELARIDEYRFPRTVGISLAPTLFGLSSFRDFFQESDVITEGGSEDRVTFEATRRRDPSEKKIYRATFEKGGDTIRRVEAGEREGHEPSQTFRCEGTHRVAPGVALPKEIHMALGHGPGSVAYDFELASVKTGPESLDAETRGEMKRFGPKGATVVDSRFGKPVAYQLGDELPAEAVVRRMIDKQTDTSALGDRKLPLASRLLLGIAALLFVGGVYAVWTRIQAKAK